ncbi:uncharacterized protein BX664DRAFT_362113 [Halteromyces radiatus]|uniref:uncharacterized protein n=1 Tax=Halteromyces radiatus TaxID=101107 RepID=UPI00221FB9C5|nr:uncharacterized protein BX664DRAFT_362113 [Halteromyces radiatus]KAI8079992.1 hypothetical protein BX664DRAFT_362113 [Halteromyces radiatus]
MLKVYLALIGLLCTLYQAAALNLNATEFIGQHVNATVYIGNIGTFTCTKKKPLSLASVAAAINALNYHYERGQWGQKCYDGWCVDARNLSGWDSPKDCMNELRDKLSECLEQNAGDGYIEQGTGFVARCMMHYWCEGC